MVGVCEWIACSAIQKRLPEKARIGECVYRDQIVKGAVDDMVSRTLGGCQDGKTVWRRQNGDILPDMSTEEAVRCTDRDAASTNDSSKTTRWIDNDIVFWNSLDIILATFLMIRFVTAYLIVHRLALCDFDIVQCTGQLLDIAPCVSARLGGRVFETDLERALDRSIEGSADLDFLC